MRQVRFKPLPTASDTLARGRNSSKSPFFTFYRYPCSRVIRRYESFNVAVAGSILMYDRLTKMGIDPEAMDDKSGISCTEPQ